MLETLLHWDQTIFFWINHGWSSTFFDTLLPLFRNKYFWIPLYIFILAFVSFNFGNKAWLFLLFSLITVVACDQLSSEVIKDAFERPRPCKIYTEVNLLIHCGSGYSFTSSHATNHFGIGTFFLLALAPVLGRWKYLFWLWAGLVSIAQVYVGVHYPFDILGGAIVGACLGWLLYQVFFKISGGLMISNEAEKKNISR